MTPKKAKKSDGKRAKSKKTKKGFDKHICCPAYPNCDIDPNGCFFASGMDVEFYGHRN